MNNSTGSIDDCETDDEFDMELANDMEDAESPELRDGSPMPNVPRLIWPVQKSNRMAPKRLVMANPIQITSNKRKMNKYDGK